MASYFVSNSVMGTTVKTIMGMLATCYNCPQKPLHNIHDRNFIRETTGSVATYTCFERREHEYGERIAELLATLWLLWPRLAVPPESRYLSLDSPYRLCNFVKKKKPERNYAKSVWNEVLISTLSIQLDIWEALPLQHAVQCKPKWLAQTGCRTSWKEISLHTYVVHRQLVSKGFTYKALWKQTGNS